MTTISDLIRAETKTPIIVSCWSHFEADVLDGTTEQAYYDASVELHRDHQTLAAQAMRNADYVMSIATHLGILRSYAAGDTTPEVIRAKNRAVADVSNVFFSAVHYDGFNEPDRVHPTGWGYVMADEVAANDIKDFRAGLQPGRPTLVSASRSGAVITFTCDMKNSTNLVLDTTFEVAVQEEAGAISIPANGQHIYGFQLYRSGAIVDISDATVAVSGNTGTITLTSDPGAVTADEELRYALQEHVGAALSAGPCRHCGGNIRSDRAPVASDYITMTKCQITRNSGSLRPDIFGNSSVFDADRDANVTALLQRVAGSSAAWDQAGTTGTAYFYDVNGTIQVNDIMRGGNLSVRVDTIEQEPLQYYDWLVPNAVAMGS